MPIPASYYYSDFETHLTNGAGHRVDPAKYDPGSDEDGEDVSSPSNWHDARVALQLVRCNVSSSRGQVSLRNLFLWILETCLGISAIHIVI